MVESQTIVHESFCVLRSLAAELTRLRKLSTPTYVRPIYSPSKDKTDRYLQGLIVHDAVRNSQQLRLQTLDRAALRSPPQSTGELPLRPRWHHRRLRRPLRSLLSLLHDSNDQG